MQQRLETVPTDVMGRPSVVIVVVTEGDQLAMRFTSKLGWSGRAIAFGFRDL